MIRELKVNELHKVFHLGDKFSAESKFVTYDKEIFVNSWTGLIDYGCGVIFIKEYYNHIAGFIGGVLFNDPNSGISTSSELFWYLDPKYRSRGIGKNLLDSFERWSKLKGCQRVIMIHMSDLMPEEVKGMYLKNGYEKLETHYIKEI